MPRPFSSGSFHVEWSGWSGFTCHRLYRVCAHVPPMGHRLVLTPKFLIPRAEVMCVSYGHYIPISLSAGCPSVALSGALRGTARSALPGGTLNLVENSSRSLSESAATALWRLLLVTLASFHQLRAIPPTRQLAIRTMPESDDLLHAPSPTPNVPAPSSPLPSPPASAAAPATAAPARAVNAHLSHLASSAPGRGSSPAAPPRPDHARPRPDAAHPELV